jgi:alginate O-acetyltransferase complex protein AlgI
MVFSSIIFLFFFFPALLIIYLLSGKKLKNLILLAASVFFYAWGAPRFVFVLLGVTFADFHLVALLHRIENEAHSPYLSRYHSRGGY